MARRKEFRKCVLKEMKRGLTKKEAGVFCKLKFKKKIKR